MTAEEFFKELKRLVDMTPPNPLHQVNTEGSQFADHVYYCKNLTYCFDCLKCEGSVYLYDSVNSVNNVDCDYCFESELCYESVDAFKCFNSDYLEDCANLTDSAYSVWCTNSHDMFGCVSIHNKSYCIFNRQLTPEQYKQEVVKYRSWPPEKILAEVEKIRASLPVTQTHEKNNENSSYGDYVYFCKNCYMCFNASNSKDCGYLYDSLNHSTSYDVTYSTSNELCYEVTDSGNCFNCNYVVYSGNCQDSSYVINSLNLKNCLGAVNRTHAEYEILHRKYSKEEYEKLSKEILADIAAKKIGWGELSFH